jgi:hypothetical protein
MYASFGNSMASDLVVLPTANAGECWIMPVSQNNVTPARMCWKSPIHGTLDSSAAGVHSADILPPSERPVRIPETSPAEYLSTAPRARDNHDWQSDDHPPRQRRPLRGLGALVAQAATGPDRVPAASGCREGAHGRGRAARRQRFHRARAACRRRRSTAACGPPTTTYASTSSLSVSDGRANTAPHESLGRDARRVPIRGAHGRCVRVECRPGVTVAEADLRGLRIDRIRRVRWLIRSGLAPDTVAGACETLLRRRLCYRALRAVGTAARRIWSGGARP